MICKNCIHDSVCKIWDYYNDDFIVRNTNNCKKFKNKADVVEVVRCKDCKHYKNEWCEILKVETPVSDGWCCYGVRKEQKNDL